MKGNLVFWLLGKKILNFPNIKEHIFPSSDISCKCDFKFGISFLQPSEDSPNK